MNYDEIIADPYLSVFALALIGGLLLGLLLSLYSGGRG